MLKKCPFNGYVKIVKKDLKQKGRIINRQVELEINLYIYITNNAKEDRKQIVIKKIRDDEKKQKTIMNGWDVLNDKQE